MSINHGGIKYNRVSYKAVSYKKEQPSVSVLFGAVHKVSSSV